MGLSVGLVPEVPHIVVRPSDRMVTQEQMVDWFAFWLLGKEDSDPVKADQYSRWRELRKLQEQNRGEVPIN